MYDNVFERVEVKYLLSKEQKNSLFQEIGGYLKKDKFYQSIICNIYFDTVHDDLIVNSLDKPPFKEKIRLRSYLVPNMDDHVFLEIKDKYKGVVGKRRIMLTLRDFYDYYEHNKCNDEQIMKEIDYYFKLYDLKPKIFIGYDRESFMGIEDEHLRITIDANLRSRREDLHLENGDYGDYYFNDDYYIVEIKSLGSMPLWLTHALSKLKIYPTSFSKYGSIYEKERRNIC